MGGGKAYAYEFSLTKRSSSTSWRSLLECMRDTSLSTHHVNCLQRLPAKTACPSDPGTQDKLNGSAIILNGCFHLYYYRRYFSLFFESEAKIDRIPPRIALRASFSVTCSIMLLHCCLSKLRISSALYLPSAVKIGE